MQRIAIALALVIVLAGCGFHLRGSGGATLPFNTVHVALPDNSALGAELKRHIRARSGTTVTTDPKAAQAVLDVPLESREKQVLSLNSQGRVREYALLYKVVFRVRDAAGKELLPPAEIVLKREVSFNEAQVIAKEHEEEMLYREMQSDLVQQVLRRLSALRPPKG